MIVLSGISTGKIRSQDATPGFRYRLTDDARDSGLESKGFVV
jgi:hypothetical protein